MAHNIIEVNHNEVWLPMLEFNRRKAKGVFDNVFIDADDPLKLCGIAEDKIYVTERMFSSLTESEIDEYQRRMESKLRKFKADDVTVVKSFERLSENEQAAIKRGELT